MPLDAEKDGIISAGNREDIGVLIKNNKTAKKKRERNS